MPWYGCLEEEPAPTVSAGLCRYKQAPEPAGANRGDVRSGMRRWFRRLLLLSHRPVHRFRLSRCAAAGHVLVAHHGIQRSGTNYLLQCLLCLRVPVVNTVEPAGTMPCHKHFRWQRDKQTIPGFIRHQYGNELAVDCVAGLNAAAGYPPGTRHLVIRKEEAIWLASILNWGLRCGWFASKEAGFAEVPVLLADYRAYNRFWQGLAAREPGRVQILDLAGLAEEPRRLCAALKALDLVFDDRGFTGVFEEVPKSPKGRPRPVTAQDIEAVYRALEESPVVATAVSA